MSETIVFIHGMFVTARCWDGWLSHFQNAQHKVVAPPWPGREKSVEALRAAHPDAAVGRLRLEEVVEHFDALVRAMPVRPVLIGHSMGGLVVQILLARGLGKKGVAIASAPPKGVFVPSWTFLKANWPVVSPFVGVHEPFLMSGEEFGYSWAHSMTLEEQKAAYDALIVPESRHIGRDSLDDVAQVNFTRKTAPLLLVAGSLDRTIPPRLTRKNYTAYAKSASRTDFHEFPGRTHLLLSQPGWEEVADLAAAWIEAR